MTDALIVRREQLLGVGAPLFYEEPIHIVRGEGVFLYDAAGRRYVDMYNNVPCVGHAHPHVVAAMQAQAATLNVHSRYLHEGVLDYAERLIAKHADGLETAVFTCTGTEANEVAIAMARRATGARGLVCSDRAYHGNSAEVSKLTHHGALPPDANPEIRSIPFPETYRPIEEGLDEESLCQRYLAELDAAIDALAETPSGFAGMLVCPILANEGLPNVPVGFMRRAAERVRERGGLFIVDEVQAGFCRTGSFWGYEHVDCRPDIVSMGKPMGNGLPLAGVVASRDLVDTFRKRTRYFNTFASSPLQAAAGSAVLDVIESEGLEDHVADVGAYLRRELARRCEGEQRLAEVRGHGLFIGIECVEDPDSREPCRELAVSCVNQLKDRGFLTSNAGAHGSVIKLRPPLVFPRDQADAFLDAFDDVIDSIKARG
ncbi:MAG: aminotransferase class III-fold pyridoxal phosphate-dependent enzyme [Acidobacteriota bacterium]|nr:aminotransferase class III-fold pyridoxal phosphate-dependent enzyme [Acidobacteriota bacterium]